MGDFQLLHFLTFVLMALGPSAWSAPQTETKPSVVKEPISQVEDPLLTEADRNQDLRLTDMIGVSFAWLGGQVTKKLDSGSQTGFGLNYSRLVYDEEIWDLQGHWLSSNSAWIQVGKKFMINSDNENEPFYRLGLSHFLDPDDALAGFFRMDSFKASVSAGFMDLGTYGRLLSAEAGLHWGLAGLAFHLQAGLHWGF